MIFALKRVIKKSPVPNSFCTSAASGRCCCCWWSLLGCDIRLPVWARKYIFSNVMGKVPLEGLFLKRLFCAVGRKEIEKINLPEHVLCCDMWGSSSCCCQCICLLHCCWKHLLEKLFFLSDLLCVFPKHIHAWQLVIGWIFLGQEGKQNGARMGQKRTGIFLHKMRGVIPSGEGKGQKWPRRQWEETFLSQDEFRDGKWPSLNMNPCSA